MVRHAAALLLPLLAAVCDATNATKLPFCPAGGATGSGCMRESSAIGGGLTLTVFVCGSTYLVMSIYTVNSILGFKYNILSFVIFNCCT